MIKQIVDNKRQFMKLLLLADEQENMIERYLERGELFVLEEEEEVKAVCVVTDEGGGVFEIKNLATAPEHQRKGYGKAMVQFVSNHYRDQGHTLLVGTGDSPLTLPFYEACGFVISHQIDNFFTDHYDHPIYEGGKQLIHMIVLKKALSE
ncbi:GNAT family N-acetyltransferase [Paenibacillus senegalensis]|uniref:GNAT family N-acetyltransferase n=1 Tax=Paenibacillus senegalensis TaxID=1465766 RepID=UPI000288B14D|nr:GNAT family N-acetyltransferase [Paenibacillus senegalensis]